MAAHWFSFPPEMLQGQWDSLQMLRRNAGRADPASELYHALMARARDPVFYRDIKVADTLDGRFDMVALHAFLVFDALKNNGAAATEFGSKLADTIFTGFDEAFRELGVSDFGMGRRIRNVADAFYGRMEAYGGAASVEQFAATVARNVYRGAPGRDREAAALASYMVESCAMLRRHVAMLLAGKPHFAPVPRLAEN